MENVTPYEIDAGKIAWATKRVKAMRGALNELPAVVTGINRASAAMKKAAKCCKAYPESTAMTSFAESLDRALADLKELFDGWNDDTNAIQLGIINYRMMEVEKSEGSDS